MSQEPLPYQTGRHPSRPTFKPSVQEYVVIRPVRLFGERWMPGALISEMPKPVKRFVLLSLYRRRQIGPVGHPWTDWQLAMWERRVAGFPRGEAQPPAEEGAAAPPPLIQNLGKGIYAFNLGDGEVRARGLQKAQEKLEAALAERLTTAEEFLTGLQQAALDQISQPPQV